MLILDRNELSRAGFTFLVEADERFDVASLPGSNSSDNPFSSLGELLSKCRPDIILIAGEEELLDSVDRVSEASAPELPPPMVAFMNHWDSDTAISALRLGVRGLGAKSESGDTIMAAIGAVAVGGTYLARGVADAVIDAASGGRAEPDLQALAKVATLTERERSVLTFLASGLTTPEIARRLAVSRATVKSHISHMLQKLDLRDRVQAVVFAYASGLAVGPSAV